MMNQISPDRIRQDCRLINSTLIKLTLPSLVIRSLVIVIVMIFWLVGISWLLDYGIQLNFDFLHPIGQPAVDLIKKIAPYLWWGISGIWTLIIFFALRAWLPVSIAASRANIVSPEVLTNLAAQLCERSLDVLRWTWDNRQEPLTVGDLRRALIEIRHQRIEKIALVAHQIKILDGNLTATQGAASDLDKQSHT